MKVILLERIETLGFMGDVVEVKPGYARNYLLPQKKALRATQASISQFETQKKELEASNLMRKSEAEKACEKMGNVIVSIIRQASETGQLYGSVRPQDIVSALSESGIYVNRNQIDLGSPVKTLGIHKARILLHPEVFVTIDVNIAQSVEEAEVAQSKHQAATAPAPQADVALEA